MGYVGWVHARREVEGWGVEDEYFDTASGAWVSATRGAEGLRVRMYVPAERKQVTYDSAEGVVRVGELDDELAERWAAEVRGRTMTADWLASELPGVTLRRETDGELDRYETSAPGGVAAVCPDGRCTVPRVEGVTWADARTGLVRRTEAAIGGLHVTCQYGYGVAAVRDVYEVGVPREARVVDERPCQ